MSNSIHGHEVMQMMIDSGKSYTKESLEQEMIEKFGSDTTFYTCSAQGMSAKELVDFLEKKGKFFGTDEGFQTSQESICNH